MNMPCLARSFVATVPREQGLPDLAGSQLMQDRSFDGKAARFQKNIYQGLKGQLRLEALWGDLCEALPALNDSPSLRVWDAGGGIGQMSERLAGLGHQVLLSDISAEMLQLAHERIAPDPQLASRIALRQASIQQLSTSGAADFDLIVCHAVLEWLAEPEAVLLQMLQRLKPGGYLSLAVYNINAAILMNVIKGNFRKVLSGDMAGHQGGLTPPNPQDPHRLIALLREAGFELCLCRGVRVAYDYLSRDLRAQRSDDDVRAVEQALRARDAFWALGRYVHLLVYRPA